MQQRFENKYARYSLVSVTAMMAFTSVHHIFRLGYELLIPSILLTALPYLLMRWYASSKNELILKSYSIFSALMFTWFGLIDGFLDHVVKALGLENVTFLPGGEAEVVKTALSFESPALSNLFYEGTGVLTFIAGAFAMVYLVKMIQAKHTADRAGSLKIAQG
jgi:hypothetical protein